MRSMIRSQARVLIAELVLGMFLTAGPSALLGQQSDARAQAGTAKKTRVVGVVKALNGNTVTLTTDNGTEIGVAIQPTTRLMKMAPGQTDLKAATPIQLSDVQVGD